MQDGNDENYDEDGLTMVYCSHCGAPLGRFDNGSKCGLLCARCKKEDVVTLREGAVTQIPRQRRKKTV